MAIKKLPSTGDAPRSTGVPESLVPGGAADSAGFPWEGRDFDHHDTAFADDDGSTPQGYAAAVRAVRGAAREGSPSALAEAHAEAILALSRIRLLVPLMAEAGDTGLTPDGRTVEKSQELSIVTVAAPDGRRVIPVFTSSAAMRAWNAEARPIPVPAPQVALAAVQENTDMLIVDPGDAELEFGVRRTALQAVALTERATPAWADPEVLSSFAASVAADDRVVELRVAPGDPEARLRTPEVDVLLVLRPGLDREGLQAVLAAAQGNWAANEIIAERVDSLRVLPRSAEEAPGGRTRD